MTNTTAALILFGGPAMAIGYSIFHIYQQNRRIKKRREAVEREMASRHVDPTASIAIRPTDTTKVQSLDEVIGRAAQGHGVGTELPASQTVDSPRLITEDGGID